ncbi:MAG: hypothetical protein V3U84_11670 [Thiotrichaceae bacterium]
MYTDKNYSFFPVLMLVCAVSILCQPTDISADKKDDEAITLIVIREEASNTKPELFDLLKKYITDDTVSPYDMTSELRSQYYKYDAEPNIVARIVGKIAESDKSNKEIYRRIIGVYEDLQYHEDVIREIIIHAVAFGPNSIENYSLMVESARVFCRPNDGAVWARAQKALTNSKGQTPILVDLCADVFNGVLPDSCQKKLGQKSFPIDTLSGSIKLAARLGNQLYLEFCGDEISARVARISKDAKGNSSNVDTLVSLARLMFRLGYRNPMIEAFNNSKPIDLYDSVKLEYASNIVARNSILLTREKKDGKGTWKYDRLIVPAEVKDLFENKELQWRFLST